MRLSRNLAGLAHRRRSMSKRFATCRCWCSWCSGTAACWQAAAQAVRQAISLCDLFFLMSIAACTLPRPIVDRRFLVSSLPRCWSASSVAIGSRRWAKQRQTRDRPAIPDLLGRARPSSSAAAGPGQHDPRQSSDLGIPGCKAVQFPGRPLLPAGTGRPDPGPGRHTPRPSSPRSCAAASWRSATARPKRPMRLVCRPGVDPAAGDHSAGAAGHRAADDQPVSERGEELHAGRLHRLSGSFLDHRHVAEPDRPRGRVHRHPDAVLS